MKSLEIHFLTDCGGGGEGWFAPILTILKIYAIKNSKICSAQTHIFT